MQQNRPLQDEAIWRPSGSGMKLPGFWSEEGFVGFWSARERNSTRGRSLWWGVRRSRKRAEGRREVGGKLRSDMRDSQCLETDLNRQRNLKGRR